MNIIPTRRFYFTLLLVLAVLLILQPAMPAPQAVSAYQLFLVLDLFVALFVLLDIILTPNKKLLSVQRDMSNRFSIGRENTVTLTIENLTDSPLRCRITDDYPQEMNCRQCDFAFSLASGEIKILSYTLTPASKGVYTFGSVYARTGSRFGFFQRQIQFSLPQQVKVYNDLQSLSELSLQLGTSTALGEIQRKNRGQGTNFTGLAEYVAGKDVTKIDWKATARAQRPIIREYDREEDQRLLILVDGGRMMFSELAGISKFDHALNAALSLSLTALTLNDQVGLGIFADGPLAYLPPRRGKIYLQKFLDVSANVTARLAEPDYLEMLSYFASRQKGRTLFVVLTDLVDAWGSRSLLSALAALRQKHLTFCVVLANERVEKMIEPDLPVTETTPFKDIQYDKILLRAVATDLLSQRQLALEVLQRRGCLVLNSTPEQLSSRLIQSYLDIKRKALL